MDQFLQSAVIAPKCDRSLERRMSTLAKPAERIGSIRKQRRQQRLTTHRTERSAQRANRLQARLANGQTRNFNQRRTTKAAIGGEKRKEQAGSGLLCPARESMIRCLALGTPYSEPGTAEDGLPPLGQGIGLPPSLSVSSIAAISGVTQCAGQTSRLWRTDVAPAWGCTPVGPEPIRTETRKLGGNNVRSEPVSAERREADTSQRDRAGANGTLRPHCICCTETSRRDDPTLREQKQTRIPPNGQRSNCNPEVITCEHSSLASNVRRYL